MSISLEDQPNQTKPTGDVDSAINSWNYAEAFSFTAIPEDILKRFLLGSHWKKFKYAQQKWLWLYAWLGWQLIEDTDHHHLSTNWKVSTWRTFFFKANFFSSSLFLTLAFRVVDRLKPKTQLSNWITTQWFLLKLENNFHKGRPIFWHCVHWLVWVSPFHVELNLFFGSCRLQKATWEQLWFG